MAEDRTVYREGLVAIEGSKIVAVGSNEIIGGAFRGAREIDARENVVLPGLSNGHRHILSGPRGASPEGLVTLDVLRRIFYPSFAALTEDDMHTFAIHHSAEMLRFGQTLFEEPGCSHLPAVLEGVAKVGIRCRTGPWTWDQKGPSGATLPSDWLKMDTAACIKRLEEGIETVRSFGNPRIRDAVTIEGVGTCSDELNRAAADLAVEADSLFVLHKATSEQEVAIELDEFGHRPLEHMYRIGALNDHTFLNHMTSLELFEVEMVAETGAVISHNPSSALRLAKGTTQTGKWPELIDAGVTVMLGTDAENASNYQDICRSMHLAALLSRDARRDPTLMPAETVVEMATLNGAKAMRWEDELGSIEVGKEADITIFDTNDFDWRPLHNPITNLVYNTTGHSVDTVIVGGDVLVENKNLVHLDEEQVREDAQRVERRILKEIGIDAVPSWPVK
ncbi:MAG: amidohydrolase family protein [Acidimicrobiia bacterium]